MPSLSELMSAMPTATQWRDQQAQQQAGLDQLTAQTQGQQIANQASQEQLDEYQAGEALRDLQRRNNMFIEEVRATPEWKQAKQTAMTYDMRNEASDAEIKHAQKMIDLIDPVVTEWQSGDGMRAVQKLDDMAGSPQFQAAMKDPVFAQFLGGLMADDPRQQANSLLEYELYKDSLAAPGERAGAAERSKAALKSEYDIKLEQEKGRQSRLTEETKAKTPGKDAYPAYKHPTTAQIDAFRAIVGQVAEEMDMQGDWGGLVGGVDEKALANQFAQDYNQEITKYPKGDPNTPTASQYIRQQMGGSTSPTAGVQQATAGFDQAVIDQYMQMYPDRTEQEIIQALQRQRNK